MKKHVSRIRIILASILVWVVLPQAGRSAETAAPVVVKVKNNNQAKTWSEQKTALLEQLTAFKPAPLKLGRYGGREDRKEKSTGFFYARKTDDGWVMVDPEGCHFFSVGVNSTGPNDTVPDTKEAFAKTFADRSNWALKTQALLVDELKYNSLGCWSDWNAFKTAGINIPYVQQWNLMAGYGKKKGVTYKNYGNTGFQEDVLPVFDKGFADYCDDTCKAMAKTKDDPWLIGHFSDNELPFKSPGIIKRYLKCPESDESRTAVENWLKEKGIDAKGIKSEHDTEFAELVLRTYYKTVHNAMKKYDPKHMILGSRLHGGASSQDICYTASGPFVDVVSINYYHRWTPDQKELDRRADLAKRPILITEWYAKGEDSDLDNSAGAGFTVPTQKDRGLFYENFTIGLLKNKNVVGWHWFRYVDDGDLKTAGKSCNKGIVDLKFSPYKELADSMRKVNSAKYQLSDYLRKAPQPASGKPGKDAR